MFTGRTMFRWAASRGRIIHDNVRNYVIKDSLGREVEAPFTASGLAARLAGTGMTRADAESEGQRIFVETLTATEHGNPMPELKSIGGRTVRLVRHAVA